MDVLTDAYYYYSINDEEEEKLQAIDKNFFFVEDVDRKMVVANNWSLATFADEYSDEDVAIESDVNPANVDEDYVVEEEEEEEEGIISDASVSSTSDEDNEDSDVEIEKEVEEILRRDYE